MASVPPNGRPAGFAVRTTGDLAAALGILAIVIGGVAWGIKLEGRNDALALRVQNIERVIAEGVLPRAEERINFNAARNDEQDRRLQKLEEHDD